MKAFKGYDETKAYGSGMEQLPKGGYVCKIMKASVESGQYGEQLVIALDIAEGDFIVIANPKYNPYEGTIEMADWTLKRILPKF